MRTFLPAVALSTLFANNSAANLAAKAGGALVMASVTTTNGTGIYEQMGVSKDGHTVSWKLRGIGAGSAAASDYKTPAVWETGDAVPTGNVFPKRIQIYVL